MKHIEDLPYKCAVKMRLYPSTAQKRIIDKNIDHARFFWNFLTATSRKMQGLGHDKSFNWPWADQRLAELKAMMNPNCRYIKDIYPFARDPALDSDVPFCVKKDWQEAWNLSQTVPGHNPPDFHRKDAAGSYTTSNHYNPKKTPVASIFNGNLKFLDAKHVFLSKIGRVRVAFSKKVFERLTGMCLQKKDVRISSATISRDACGDYFVSFQISSDIPYGDRYEKTGKEAGYDLNVENLWTDSNGYVVANPHFYVSAEERLAREQRKLSRRREEARKEEKPLRDAKNYQKQRVKVAELTRSVRRKRHAFLDRITTDAVKNQDFIALENLKVKNLTRNHHLAKAIGDVSMGTIRRMFEQKAAMHGKTVVVVPARNTTQTCSVCGHVLEGKERLTLKDREWTCPRCKTHHSRDHNAAKVILQRAKAQYAKEQAVSAGNAAAKPS